MNVHFGIRGETHLIECDDYLHCNECSAIELTREMRSGENAEAVEEIRVGKFDPDVVDFWYVED